MPIFAGVLLVLAVITGGVVLHMIVEIIRNRNGLKNEEL